MCKCKTENELYYRNNNEFLGVREIFIDNYGEYKGNLVICTGKKNKRIRKRNYIN